MIRMRAIAMFYQRVSKIHLLEEQIKNVFIYSKISNEAGLRNLRKTSRNMVQFLYRHQNKIYGPVLGYTHDL